MSGSYSEGSFHFSWETPRGGIVGPVGSLCLTVEMFNKLSKVFRALPDQCVKGKLILSRADMKGLSHCNKKPTIGCV